MSNCTMRALFCATIAAVPTVPAWAATVNGDYTFTIVQQARAIQRSEAYSDTVMLEDGSVATIVRDIGNTSRIPHKIRIIAPDGSVAREIVAPSSDFSFGNGSGQGLSVNEAGQIVLAAFDADARRSQLLLIEPDDTVRVLIDAPAVQPTGVADATLASFADVKINESGEIAVSGTGRLADGTPLTRIVKISDTSSGAPSFAILDQATPSGAASEDRSNPDINVAIDDAGTVAWRRSAGDRNEVILSDGVTEQVGLFSESPFSGPRIRYDVSALTNSGLLAVTASSGFGGDASVGTSDITNGLTDEDYDPAFPTPRRANDWDSNEFGHAFAFLDQAASASGGVIVEGETIAEEGLAVGGLELSRAGNFDGYFRAANGEFSNDVGQLAFEAWGRADLDGNGSAETYNLVIRADPIGATPDHPILPVAEDGTVTTVSYELVNALGLTRPIYVDPDPAERFDYLLTSGPLITSLVIPDQDLGAEDGIFEILFGGFSESLAFGEVLDFTTFAGFEGGLSAFSIAGIDISSGITTDDPFVVGLTHARLGTVDLRITGRATVAAPVPLPAGVWLLLSGLGLVFVTGRRTATTSDCV